MGATLDCCTAGLLNPHDSNIDDYGHKKRKRKQKKKKNRDNIEVEIIELNEKYASKCKSLLINTFIINKFDTVHYDLQNKQVFKKIYIDYYLSKSLKTENNVKSFIAINKNNDKEVIAVLICDNYSNEMDEKTTNNLQTASHSVEDDYKKIFELNKEIKKKFNQNNKINNDIFEFKFSAVKIDYHRLGIMTKLKKFALQQAKKLNYKKCISIALNQSTIKLNEKIGFKEEIRIKYYDFKQNNTFPFRSAVEKTKDEFAVLMQIDL